jgi:A/G-specific adenine glycosylase
MAKRRAAMTAVAPRLLAWFQAARRDLPWRRRRDPWAIWVSEVMLQQTRVEAVRLPFERFLLRFPTPAEFAAATDDELLVAWRGLGYYRRARLLRDGARTVVRDHGGIVPPSLEQLARLPGIGDYTGGAVASIAFGVPVAAIDGNVERVVARHRGIRGDVARVPARGEVRRVVGEWLDPRRPGDFNQALMELGALVCTPAAPRCDACPIAADCVARRAGLVDRLPERAPRRTPQRVSARAILVLDRQGVLGYRLGPEEPNAGQIDLPGGGVLASVDPADLAGVIARRFGARVDVGSPVAAVRHAITCHRITLTVHAATVQRRGRLQRFPLTEGTPWTTTARKIFAAVVGARGEAEA